MQNLYNKSKDVGDLSAIEETHFGFNKNKIDEIVLYLIFFFCGGGGTKFHDSFR